MNQGDLDDAIALLKTWASFVQSSLGVEWAVHTMLATARRMAHQAGCPTKDWDAMLANCAKSWPLKETHECQHCLTGDPESDSHKH